MSDSDAESGDWEHGHEELDTMQKMNVEQLVIPPLYSAGIGSTGEGGQEEWEVKIPRPRHKRPDTAHSHILPGFTDKYHIPARGLRLNLPCDSICDAMASCLKHCTNTFRTHT